MATSTLRGLIVAALVVLGVIGLTKLFPQNASLGVTPSPGVTTTTPPDTANPTPSSSPTQSRPLRAKNKVVVLVVNGTSTNGLAALFTQRLKEDGYKTKVPGDYGQKVDASIVLYLPDYLPEAERLQRQRFPTAVLRATPANFPAGVHLEVVLGRDVLSS